MSRVEKCRAFDPPRQIDDRTPWAVVSVGSMKHYTTVPSHGVRDALVTKIGSTSKGRLCGFDRLPQLPFNDGRMSAVTVRFHNA